MNWEPISAVSEIVGAIAVIITLVYLARQIAMSNKFAKAEAWRSRFSEFTSLNAAYGVHTDFYHAMAKLHGGSLQADLNEDERALANSFLVSALQIYEQLYREVQSGILDPAALDEFPGHSGFGMPYVKEQWPVYRRILTSSVVTHLEDRYGLGQ